MQAPARPRSIQQRLCGVAFAAVAVTVFAALSGAAAGSDGGEGPGTAPPAVAAADAGIGAADAGSSPDAGARADAKRQRRIRRMGANADGGFPRDGADGRLRWPPIVPRAVAPPVVPAIPATPPGPAPSGPPSEIPFNTCQKVPRGKRAVKLTLKPDTELPTLVAWISSITCKPFVLPSHLGAAGKKVTLVAPGTMTPEEAYAAFLNALDAVGLAVERAPGYLRIIETSHAKSTAVPIYDFNGRPTR